MAHLIPGKWYKIKDRISNYEGDRDAIVAQYVGVTHNPPDDEDYPNLAFYHFKNGMDVHNDYSLGPRRVHTFVINSDDMPDNIITLIDVEGIPTHLGGRRHKSRRRRASKKRRSTRRH